MSAIACVSAHACVLEVNALGQVWIDPISYTEGALANPGQPNVPEPEEGVEVFPFRN